MKAIEVIRIGRKRRRQASSVASTRLMPPSCSLRANSMIRIAFLDDRPMMAIKPTLKYTSFGKPRSVTASTAPKMPSGTTSSTANGIAQLSYSAARHRNTTISEMANSSGACAPDCRSSYEVPDHSKPKPGGNCCAICSIAATASPVLRPGAGPPEIFIAGKPL